MKQSHLALCGVAGAILYTIIGIVGRLFVFNPHLQQCMTYGTQQLLDTVCPDKDTNVTLLSDTQLRQVALGFFLNPAHEWTTSSSSSSLISCPAWNQTMSKAQYLESTLFAQNETVNGEGIVVFTSTLSKKLGPGVWSHPCATLLTVRTFLDYSFIIFTWLSILCTLTVYLHCRDVERAKERRGEDDLHI